MYTVWFRSFIRSRRLCHVIPMSDEKVKSQNPTSITVRVFKTETERGGSQSVSIMSSTLVLPGDTVTLPSTSAITLGPGISASSSRVTLDGSTPAPSYIATRAGLLGSTKGKEKGRQLWVDGSSKRVSLTPRDDPR